MWRDLGDKPAAGADLRKALLDGLRDLGDVEGRNLAIEYLFADGRVERFSAIATELIALKVDVIVVGETLSALAAKHATTTIPEPRRVGIIRPASRTCEICGAIVEVTRES